MCCESYVFRTFTNEKFGSVQAVKIGGKVYFVEDDVRHCLRNDDTCCEVGDDERTPVMDGLVSERGLYTLAICSRMDEGYVLMFKQWIESDVLPSLEEPMDVAECLRQLQMQVLHLKEQLYKCDCETYNLRLEFDCSRQDFVSYEIYDVIDGLRDRIEALEKGSGGEKVRKSKSKRKEKASPVASESFF